MLTSPGRNANIFYEVGFAHALKKPVILIAREVADVPFDLKGYKCIVYGGDFETLRSALQERLEWFEERGEEAPTVPVSGAKMREKFMAEHGILETRRDQVFVSYCHADARWLQRLQVHLAPLERNGNVMHFDDTMITPGENWRSRISEALARARVAVLLVSADFLASEFIFANELPPLLAAAKAEGTLILSIILSPCRFEKIANLTQFQAVNAPSRPLTKMTKNQQEELFVSVVDTIETTLFYGGAA